MAQYKSQKYALPKQNGGDGDACYMNDAAVVDTALAAADTIDFVIPKGFELSSLRFYHDQLDSNGSPTLAVKIGFVAVDGASTVQSSSNAALAVNDTYFLATATAFGRSATGFYCHFPSITFEIDVLLRITITTAAATKVAGTVRAILGGNQVGVR